MSFLNLQSLLGLAVIVLVCWALSENRRRFPWKLALGAVAIQAAIVLAVFAIPGAEVVLSAITGAVDGLARATDRGTQFIFGYLGGGDQPYAVTNQPASVRAVASVMAKGTSSIRARVWARSVLPQPVGPAIKMLLFCSSTSLSALASWTRL